MNATHLILMRFFAGASAVVGVASVPERVEFTVEMSDIVAFDVAVSETIEITVHE